MNKIIDIQKEDLRVDYNPYFKVVNLEEATFNL